MAISWPAILPLPTVEGYAVRPSESILRTEMEAGPARQRRRYRSTPSRITVRWVLSRDHFAVFESWYHWFAQEGGAWFTIPLLGGLGLMPHEARFTRTFEAHLKGGTLWEVVSELEIRERPRLSKDLLTIALIEESAPLLQVIGEFHIFLHHRLNLH